MRDDCEAYKFAISWIPDKNLVLFESYCGAYGASCLWVECRVADAQTARRITIEDVPTYTWCGYGMNCGRRCKCLGRCFSDATYQWIYHARELPGVFMLPTMSLVRGYSADRDNYVHVFFVLASHYLWCLRKVINADIFGLIADFTVRLMLSEQKE